MKTPIEEFYQLPKMVRDHYSANGTAWRVKTVRYPPAKEQGTRILVDLNNGFRDVWQWNRGQGWRILSNVA